MSFHHFHHPRYCLPPLSLTHKELEELDQYFDSATTPACLKAVDALHGFLTSVALLPSDLDRERWLPLIWGVRPAFKDPGQGERLISHVMRMHADIALGLADPDISFSPLVSRVWDEREQAYSDGARWCTGFLLGMALLEDEWSGFLELSTRSCLLLPIFLLGADTLHPARGSLAPTLAQRAELTDWIPVAIEAVHIQHFVLELSALRQSWTSVGCIRGLCACGSGHPTWSCCGAARRFH